MRRTWRITDLMTLLVFGVFAVCVLLVLLTGARIYQDMVRSGSEAYEARTAVQYIATRVRQAEAVYVDDFGGCEAMVIPEQIDGENYVTRVYCYDGYMRELFCEENAVLVPEDGETVLPLERLSFSVQDGVLNVEIDEQNLKMYLRGKEGDMP